MGGLRRQALLAAAVCLALPAVAQAGPVERAAEDFTDWSRHFASCSRGAVRCDWQEQKDDPLYRRDSRKLLRQWKHLQEHFRREVAAGRVSGLMLNCVVELNQPAPALAEALAGHLEMHDDVGLGDAVRILAGKAAPGADRWLARLADAEPISPQHVREIRVVLAAALERRLVTSKTVARIARLHHPVLVHGDVNEGFSVLRKRFLAAKQFAERESIARTAGAILGKHPKYSFNAVFAVDRDPLMEGVVLTEALEQSKGNAKLAVTWVAALAGANHGRIFAYARAAFAEKPHGSYPASELYDTIFAALCSIEPGAIADREFPQGMLRLLFTYGNEGLILGGGFYPAGQIRSHCRGARGKKWANWLIAQRHSALVNSGRFLEIVLDFELDLVESWAELSTPEDDAYQAVLMDKWCETLTKQRRDAVAVRKAIRGVLASSSKLGKEAFGQVLFCPYRHRRHVTVWAEEYAAHIPKLSRPQFRLALEYLARLAAGSDPALRDGLLAATRAYRDARKQDKVLEYEGLLFEWQALRFPPAVFERAIRVLATFDLRDAARLEQATRSLRSVLHARIESRDSRASISKAFDQAVSVIASPSAELSKLFAELRKEIQTWEPFVFSG